MDPSPILYVAKVNQTYQCDVQILFPAGCDVGGYILIYNRAIKPSVLLFVNNILLMFFF